MWVVSIANRAALIGFQELTILHPVSIAPDGTLLVVKTLEHISEFEFKINHMVARILETIG